MTTFEYFPKLGSYSLKATARFLGGLEIKVSFRIDHRLLGVRSRGTHIDRDSISLIDRFIEFSFCLMPKSFCKSLIYLVRSFWFQ